jgi:nucleoside-diphosphate-sugar epimerase
MGFIGQHTIRELRTQHPDAKITCLDNLSLSKEVNLGVDFIKGDVRNQPLVSDLVGRCRKGIIHLAADSRVLPSLQDPGRVLDNVETNVCGTANILAGIARNNPQLHLVYAGSSTAYGLRPCPQTEATLPDVQSPYSATKLAAEHLVRSFVVTFGIKATTLRYFQVYGPGQPTSGAYALVTGIFQSQAKAGKPLTIEGDGTQTRDFIHVTDVARANVMAFSLNSQGWPINIGSGEQHSIKELADLISPNQVHLPARPIDLLATQADLLLAKGALGWKPLIDFKQGITQLMD